MFTWWPIAWADGQPVMNPEGTQSLLNSDENKGIYSVFRSLVEDGTALMPDTKTETGPTWTSYFPKGNIGIMPMPASLQGMANATLQDADIGVTPIAGLNGGRVHLRRWRCHRHLQGQQGGRRGLELPGLDGRATRHRSRSWPRVATWSPGRTSPATSTARRPAPGDLQHHRGKGSDAVREPFGQTFNDPQGPWLVLLRDAVFGDASKIDADNDAINASLSPSQLIAGVVRSILAARTASTHHSNDGSPSVAMTSAHLAPRGATRSSRLVAIPTAAGHRLCGADRRFRGRLLHRPLLLVARMSASNWPLLTATMAV